MDDEDELTEAERRALAALPDEAALPTGLEDRVVESLRERGLVREHGLLPPGHQAGTPGRRRLFHLAAAAGLFGTGLGTGLLLSSESGRETGEDRGTGSGPAPSPAPRSMYLLLLYPGPGLVEVDAAGEAARVAEYGAWAAALRHAGQLVSAEKLGDGGRLLEANEPSASAPAEGPLGFFLVRSRTLAEAEELARSCPHLRHGGRVAVHPVDPT
jgi:hypothetical protein